ncbi:MAG: archaeal heat shock protein Hsp20 [Candidatus Heimdallarchaeota archaeon]
MSWWDDDWRSRKKQGRRGYWDDIFDRMLDDINAMFRDFARWPEFPEKIRPFMRDDKIEDKKADILGPFIYGFKYTISPDGEPQFEEFGNIKPSPKGAITRERSEPLVDIMEAGPDELKIIAELPGVRKEDIKLKTTERTMLITAGHGKYNYQKKLDLPVEVHPESAKARYNNGVLEVTLKVRHPKLEEDFSGRDIDIE